MPSSYAYDKVCDMLYTETEFQKMFLTNLNLKETYIVSQVCKSWNNVIKSNIDDKFVKFITENVNILLTHKVLIKNNTYIIPFYFNISYDIDTNDENLIKIINYIPEFKKDDFKNRFIEIYKKYLNEAIYYVDGEKFLYHYIIYYYIKMLIKNFNFNLTDLTDDENKIYNEYILQEQQDDYDTYALYNEEEFDDYNDY
jgi:hypothetical protein